MQPAPSMAARGDVWSMPAPAMPARVMHLIDAIQMLIPPSLAPSLQLEVMAADLNAPAHWTPGSRWGALQAMLRVMGLQARLDGKTLRIAPVTESDPKAAAARPTAAPQRPMVPAAAPAAVRIIPVFKPIPLWTLKANQAISVGLDAWAGASGWKVVWNVPQDWLVPNTVQFQGDFRAAATQVIQALAANGADIRADVYTANKTLVVHAAGQGA